MIISIGEKNNHDKNLAKLSLLKTSNYTNIIWYILPTKNLWLSRWHMLKNLPANTGDTRHLGSIPESGKSPGVESGNLLRYPCLENPMDRGAWWSVVCGVAWVRCDWGTEHTHNIFCKYHTQWGDGCFASSTGNEARMPIVIISIQIVLEVLTSAEQGKQIKTQAIKGNI